MTTDSSKCDICGSDARREKVPSSHMEIVDCPHCKKYCFDRMEVDRAEDTVFGCKGERGRVSALLFERRTLRPKTLPPAFVSDVEAAKSGFRDNQEKPFAIPIRVSELLATWPRTVPDQLDRAIALLAAKYPKGGEIIRPPTNENVLPSAWVLAEDSVQSRYLQQHLLEIGWIENPHRDVHSHTDRRITPKGWQRVSELSRESSRSNPAFIARWFGKPKPYEKDQSDRSADMAELLRVIESSIKDAGFRSTKADSEDYNTGIMDKVLHDIRRAPFVVADFTNPNLGVYYESGVAVGHGIPVIPCCPNEKFKELVHFDIAHVNFLVYDSNDDLATKLRNRILGSIGEGPFFKERGSKDA